MTQITVFCVILAVVAIIAARGSLVRPKRQGWIWEDEDIPSSTTSSTTSTTSTQSLTTPPLNQMECIRACPKTSEYRPVCATNGITYNNEGHLRCANKCGIDARKRFDGSCRGPPPMTSSGTSTTTTVAPAVDYMRCLRACPTTPEYNPVCGSDRVTYDNESKLRCAKQCGTNVDRLFHGNCNARTQITTSTTPSAITQSPTVQNCIRKCRVTSEYSPVCGSNGVTYENESQFRCANSCGLNVRRVSEGKCNSA